MWIHWGDVPTWFAAFGAGAAAVYAALAFKSQKRQVAELESKQVLNDQLLAYQAHLHARTFTEQVTFDYSCSADRTEFSANLKNGSAWNVRDVKTQAWVDGTPCAPAEQRKLINNVKTLTALQNWASGARLTAEEAAITVLHPNEGRVWGWRVPTATSKSTVEVDVRFTDEVGGRWEYRNDGLVHLLTPPTTW